VSAIPRRVARRIDALSRAAHRFHRFAHHPLCDEYAGEVLRIGRRARVCRGCASIAIGGVVGLSVAAAIAVPMAAAAALGAGAVAWVGFSSLGSSARRAKLVTRFLPACGAAFTFGECLRTGGLVGLATCVVLAASCGMLVSFYRRRGPDRTPCRHCPERLLSSPCRGFVEIVRRERAFRRLSLRVLSRAGL
jgi:hypothetical protein